MPTYIGLLRAVNVRPRWVRMERLREVLHEQGFGGVETYIQSGNVRVTSTSRAAATVEEELRTVISTAFGFDVPVVVRTPAQLRSIALSAAGLDSPIGVEGRRYVTFLSGDPEPLGVEALHGWDVPTEAARVVGRDVVLFLSSGVGTAKLTNARIERLTGTVGTARSLSVVEAMADRWG